MAYAQVHRFRDFVAVAVSSGSGQGQTVYMSAAQARKLARALNGAARSVSREQFTESTCGTFAISFDGSIYRGDAEEERRKKSA